MESHFFNEQVYHTLQHQIDQSPAPVTLIAVTKYSTVEQMKTAYSAGVRHFGENKVQDALSKMTAFPKEHYPDLQWHLIGHLQSNKVNKLTDPISGDPLFNWIHSMDSVDLATRIASKFTGEKPQAGLLQVNISGEASKSGFSPSELSQAFSTVYHLPGLSLQGLMTMAPLDADADQLHSIFSQLKQLRDQLETAFQHPLPQLSMGMSRDYAIALQHGSTMIRVGTSLFKS